MLKSGDRVCARVFMQNFCGTAIVVSDNLVTIAGGWCTDRQTETFNNGGELPEDLPQTFEMFDVGNTWIAGTAKFTAPEHEPVVYSNRHLLERDKRLREWQEDDQC